MSIGSAMADSVQALLSEMGQTVTFRRTAVGAYNPSTGTASSGADSDESALVAFAPYTTGLFPDSLIETGDRLAYMSAQLSTGEALAKTPQPGDELIGVAETVRVIDVQHLEVGGTPIGYICLARR